MPAPNRYFICLSYEDKPRAWDLWDDSEKYAPAYFRESLRVMERELGPRGIAVYLTWRLDRLPTNGQDVVAVVMGDEWARIPRFASDVLATFKVYGTRPSFGGSLLKPPWSMNIMLGVKYVRSCIFGIPGWVRRSVSRIDNAIRVKGAMAPMFPVPLGYGNQLDLPITPLNNRAQDMFFAGSVEHGLHHILSPKRWLRNPKTIARHHMLRSLNRIREEHAEWKVDFSTTSSFTLNDLHYGTGAQEEILSKSAYSDKLMDTRICLAPRGTSVETYRYFEGLRYGCIVLAEPQPKRWFYDGAPVVEVTDWSRLPQIAEQLLANPAEMFRMHQSALKWWKEKCSEDAVGRYMADKIMSLLPGAMRSSNA